MVIPWGLVIQSIFKHILIKVIIQIGRKDPNEYLLKAMTIVIAFRGYSFGSLSTNSFGFPKWLKGDRKIVIINTQRLQVEFNFNLDVSQRLN